MAPRRRRPPRPGALADLAPLRILKQIVLLQLSFYATALILIVFTVLAAGKHMSLDLLLGWEVIRGDITEGWMMGLVWMLNSLISVVFILLLIARSKLVPDFVLTIHFIHLVITTLYSRSLPRNYFWWLVQIASTALMIFLGIWSCQWRELRPIYFGGKDTGVVDGSEGSDGHQGSQLMESGAGSNTRGRSRTRGPDSAGDYEMVDVQEV